MKKIIVVSLFLASSTLYVFSRTPVMAALLSSTPDDNNGETVGTTTRQGALLTYVASLEASIAKIEGAAAAATVALVPAPAKKTVSTPVAKPKQKAAIPTSPATTSVVVPARTPSVLPATTSSSASEDATAYALRYQRRYNSGNGALMEADGTPVQAPDGAQQSANGLWYSGGQAYAVAPAIGTVYSEPAQTPGVSVPDEQPNAPATPAAGSSTPAPTPAPVIAAPTSTSDPVSQTSTRRSRDRDDDDD
ncbi:MAG: hypothetical protein WC798_02785 [Candidatus Paceibacterota bacterium]